MGVGAVTVLLGSLTGEMVIGVLGVLICLLAVFLFVRPPLSTDTSFQNEDISVGLNGFTLGGQFFPLDGISLSPIQKTVRALNGKLTFSTRSSYEFFEQLVEERRRYREQLERELPASGYRGAEVRVEEFDWRHALAVHVVHTEAEDNGSDLARYLVQETQ